MATGFLTVDEAAAYLGLSSKTVLRAYRGEGPYRAHPLPGYKPSPRVLRFTTADIDAWLRSAVAPRTPSEYTGTGRVRLGPSAPSRNRYSTPHGLAGRGCRPHSVGADGGRRGGSRAPATRKSLVFQGFFWGE